MPYQHNESEQRLPGFWLSVTPVIILVALLSVSIWVFGDSMLAGPSQFVLMIATAVGVSLAILLLKYEWVDLESAMVQSISRTMPANLILLMVGGICGAWMHSGIIPTMIYYGLDVLSADWLLLTSCLLSALVSVCIGSSWTTIATIGIGLIGVGRALGVNEAWMAGAIISGAYFGDKMSPLSETTNLASSISGVDLFAHIRNMLYTTVPSLAITLIVYMLAGFFFDKTDSTQEASAAAEMQIYLKETFLISSWLLLVPLGVFFLIWRGMSATMVLFLGMLVGCIIVCFRQDPIFAMKCAFGEVGYITGHEVVDSLTSTRGMSGMLNTIWLIICSMCFGGVMERSGMLASLTNRLLRIMFDRISTVLTTCLSSFFLNLTTGDQCLAIILPSKMYGATYQHLNLPNKLLSRSIEDGGTVTSVLIPWNSCGMTQSTVLGVSTLMYAPYAIFCWLSPVMSVLLAVAVQLRGSKSDENDECYKPKK